MKNSCLKWPQSNVLPKTRWKDLTPRQAGKKGDYIRRYKPHLIPSHQHQVNLNISMVSGYSTCFLQCLFYVHLFISLFYVFLDSSIHLFIYTLYNLEELLDYVCFLNNYMSLCLSLRGRPNLTEDTLYKLVFSFTSQAA